MNIDMLDSKLSRGGQDITLTRLFKVDNNKLRISIKSDGNRSQCFARCEIYNKVERQWNELVVIEPGLMETIEGLHYKNETDPPAVKDFVIDETELLRMAELILT